MFVKNNLLIRLSTILSFILFILSTKLFSWNEILNRFPSIAIIQLPSRFLLPAIVLILFSLGLTIETMLTEEKSNKIQQVTLYVSLIFLTFFGFLLHHKTADKQANIWTSDDVYSRNSNTISTTENSNQLRESFRKENSMDTPLEMILKPTSDYVPLKNEHLAKSKDLHPYYEYREAIFNNPLNPKITKSVQNRKLNLEWTLEETEEVLLPVFVYQRTELVLNGEKLEQNDFEVNNIGVLKVHAKEGENILTMSYKNSILFYYMCILTIVSWIVYLLLLLQYMRKKLSII